MKLQERIERKLRARLSPTHLEVDNESSQHSVPADSETHFRVVVVSTVFADLNRIARQRLVNEILKDELHGGIHALTQRCLTPEEFAQAKSDFRSPSCRGGGL